MGRLGDEAKTAYFGTYLPVQLGYFESLLSKNEGKGYFVGDDFTIVGSCCVVFHGDVRVCCRTVSCAEATVIFHLVWSRTGRCEGVVVV